MTQTSEGPPRGGGCADGPEVVCLSANASDIAQNPAPAQDKFRNPRAVREAKRLLRLEFLHECAGRIQIHAALVQTFAEIGDRADVCYAFRQLFAHARAAHPVYVELRDEPREAP
jgi:hypothetical protein